MICPYCGAENAEETTFCTSCGFDMTAPIPEDDVSGNKPVAMHKAPRKRSKKRCPVQNRRAIISIMAVVAFVIGISILIGWIKDKNGYVGYEHNVYAQIYEKQVYIIQDAKNAKPTKLQASTIKQHQTSMDGGVVAFLTDENVLAVIRNGRLTPVAENVINFVLSVDGTGLGYLTANLQDESATLKLYNIVKRKSKTVTYQHEKIIYDLAPDGDSLAYYVQAEGHVSSDLIFFDGKKNIPITNANLSLMGLSNDGKYIYTVTRDETGGKTLYCYNQDGIKTTIGSCNVNVAYLNADHTQILYYNSTRTGDVDKYETNISVNGQEGTAILTGASIASPLIPRSCTTFTTGTTVTAPINNFFGKAFSCWGETGMDIWVLNKKAEKSEQLVSDVKNVNVSENGKVYYMIDTTLRVLEISNGARASEKAVTLGIDVVNYKFTFDGKKVYYQTKTDLYCVNGRNGKNQKKIAENVELGLFMNAKGVVYYMIENDVYASKNGGKNTLVMSDAESISSSLISVTSITNNVIYIVMNDDSIYASDGKMEPKLVWAED